jgi:hypothetical protein
MAATTYIVGNDGDVTIGSVDLMKVRSFAATVSRTKQDVTAFGDAAKRVRYGFLNVSGSLNGVMLYGTATSTTSFWSGTTTQSLTLTLAGTGTTVAKIVSGVGFDSFAFNSDKSGDATVTANFETGDGTAPVVTWLT